MLLQPSRWMAHYDRDIFYHIISSGTVLYLDSSFMDSNSSNLQLFGHEILAILCGLVWGLWPGFGITAAGTLIGEIGNF